MEQLTVAPRTGHKTLLYSELVTDMTDLKADIAILGVPFAGSLVGRVKLHGVTHPCPKDLAVLAIFTARSE